jgi:hypothetical protein
VTGSRAVVGGAPPSAAGVTQLGRSALFVATGRGLDYVRLPGSVAGVARPAAEFDTTILGAVAGAFRALCGGGPPIPSAVLTLADGRLLAIPDEGDAVSFPGLDGSTPPAIGRSGIYLGLRNGAVVRIGECGEVRELAPPAPAAVTGSLVLEEMIGGEAPDFIAVWFLRADGTLSTTGPGLAAPVRTGAGSGFLAMGRFTSGPLEQILVADTTGVLSLWNRDGTPVPGWPVSLDGPLRDPPALFDFDGDGAVEAVLRTGSGRIHVLNWDGSEVPGWPRLLPGGEPFAAPPVGIQTPSGPALLAGGESGRLFLLDASGNTLPGWPLSTGSHIPRWIGLVAGGHEALAYSVGEGGGVDLFRMHPESPSPLWPEPGGGPERRSVAAPPAPSSPAELLAEADLFCYPNPSRGEPVRIRYLLGDGASVSAKVFRLTGEEIDAPRITGTGERAPGEASLVWDVSDIASGVYWVRVEAKSGAGSRSALRKVAVLK